MHMLRRHKLLLVSTGLGVLFLVWFNNSVWTMDFNLFKLPFSCALASYPGPFEKAWVQGYMRSCMLA